MKHTALFLSIALAAGTAQATEFDDTYALASITFTTIQKRIVPGVAFTLRHGYSELRAGYDAAGHYQLAAGINSGMSHTDVIGSAGAAWTDHGALPYVALEWSNPHRQVSVAAVSFGTVDNYLQIGQRIGYRQENRPGAPVAPVHVADTALPPISTEPVPPGATGPQTPPVASGEGIDPSADPVLTGPGTGAPPPEPVTDPVTGETIQPAPAPTCPSEPTPSVGGVSARNGFGDGSAPGNGAQHANEHAPAGTDNPNHRGA